MAKKKNESIADQISCLENDLEEKSAQLKVYDKLFDKLLVEVFGLKKAEIDALISKNKSASMGSSHTDKVNEADEETRYKLN